MTPVRPRIRVPHWQSWLGSIIVLIAFSIVPTLLNYENRYWYDVIGPFDYYAYLLQHGSMLPLLLPLVASMPFVVAFSGQLTNRFLTYTRTRAAIRRTLLRRFITNGTITFAVFFAVGVVPQIVVALGQKSYDTAGYGLDSPEQIEVARLGSKTFSQLLIYGEWVPVVSYATYLGASAALYASLSLCSVTISPNRILGLTIPWIAYLLTSFLMAILWLEAYSVALVFPFNLQQLPLGNLMYPFGLLLFITILSVSGVLTIAPRLAQLQ